MSEHERAGGDGQAGSVAANEPGPGLVAHLAARPEPLIQV